MLKKALALIMLLPTFSWGASCIVPAKDLEIAGLYPGEPVNQYIAKLNGEAINIKTKNDNGYTEGDISFDESTDQGRFTDIKEVKIRNIGKGYIGYISFEINSNKISSYAFGMSSERVADKYLKLINSFNIPLEYWTIDKVDDAFRYICDDYEIKAYMIESRGEITLIFYSRESAEYNKKNAEYYFTAKDIINPNIYRREEMKLGAYNAFNLYDSDPIFKNKLDENLLEKLKMDIDDFELTTGFEEKNIINKVIVFHFEQKPFNIDSVITKAIIAYDPEKNKMLSITTNKKNFKRTYGDKESSLMAAILNYKIDQ